MLRAVKSLFILPVLIFVLSSCSSSGSDDGESTGEQTFTIRNSSSTVTGSNGEAELIFTLTSETTAFQIHLEVAGTELVQVISLVGPDGSNLISESDTKLSGATIAARGPIALNFPILATQSVIPGSYQLRIRTYQNKNDKTGSAQGSVSVTGTLITKEDKELTKGKLHLNLVLAGPLADNEDTYDAVNKAIEKLERIFEQVNIAITRKFYNFANFPSTFPNPKIGDSIYETISTATDPGLNIIFASDVDGLDNRNNEFALESANPCSALPGTKNGIAFSVLESAGSDGQFDGDSSSGDRFDDQVILLSQNIAHYIGRCLGLSPTIEFSGSIVVGNDNLADTPSCLSLDSCEQDNQANENVMFPFPLAIPNKSNKFFSRDQFSPSQASIMQRSVLVQ